MSETGSPVLPHWRMGFGTSVETGALRSFALVSWFVEKPSVRSLAPSQETVTEPKKKKSQWKKPLSFQSRPRQSCSDKSQRKPPVNIY